MKTLLLTPNDVLFFRDGRPMEGSLAGHSSAWCPPHLISHALHAALHRSGLKSHKHCAGVSSRRNYSGERNQVFGSLLTAGPFPVDADGNWYFPAPGDLLRDGSGIHSAFRLMLLKNPSSLPKPLTHALASRLIPAKDSSPGGWLRADAWGKYLRNEMLSPEMFKTDGEIGDLEVSIGIGIDPETGTQDKLRIYSAHYLRLRSGWRLGALASADDKEYGDLLAKLFPAEKVLLIGGQQRCCSVECTDSNPFPVSPEITTPYLRWTLLSPAVFPEIEQEETRGIRPHPGGWLPNWIDPENGNVLLKQNVERQHFESRLDWRIRVRNSGKIAARLIAAKIGNALPVSGWNLGYGAKPTQLAVPSGSIYYFECSDVENARQLCSVLNYPNRRSTLWGEKGYGIGICSSFDLK